MQLCVASQRANTKAWKTLLIRLGFPPDATAVAVSFEVESSAEMAVFSAAGQVRHLVEVHDLGIVLADDAVYDASTEEVRYATGRRHLLVPWGRIRSVRGDVSEHEADAPGP